MENASRRAIARRGTRAMASRGSDHIEMIAEMIDISLSYHIDRGRWIVGQRLLSLVVDEEVSKKFARDFEYWLFCGNARAILTLVDLA